MTSAPASPAIGSIHPPAERPSEWRGDDRQQRGHGIGDNVDVCRAKVEVVIVGVPVGVGEQARHSRWLDHHAPGPLQDSSAGLIVGTSRFVDFPTSDRSSSNRVVAKALTTRVAVPPHDSLRALDRLNFFLAALQSGFGPFVAIHLADRGWEPANIGFVLTASGVAGLLTQVPSGELLDVVQSKRALVGAGSIAVALAALILGLWPNFLSVFAASVMQGATGGIPVSFTADQRRRSVGRAFQHDGDAVFDSKVRMAALPLGWGCRASESRSDPCGNAAEPI